MTELTLDSAVSSDLTNAVEDFSVNPEGTDGPSDQNETKWTNTNFEQWFAYSKQIPELGGVIDAKATWTVGKGFVADPDTTMILDSINGWGKDTFNTILENMIRTYHIGGDAFCEIIRDEKKNLINIKPLDPSSISIIVDRKGMLKRYEQNTKVKGEKPKKFDPEKIFHLARNRVADEIHGTSITEKLVEIILMKNEAMADQRQLMHRHVRPLVKFILNTDDETEIATFKAKADAIIASGENLYLPKDTAEHEIISIPANATLNPLPWIESLDAKFYEAAQVPKIIVGGGGGFTEAAVKIAYLAFQQTIEEEQLFIEEQCGKQLGIEINLEFPASLENELLSDNKKDGAQNIDSSETTAGEGQ